MTIEKKERPSISIEFKEGTGEAEAFQNNVLRPVIKAQHEILMLMFRQYLLKRKINTGGLNESKQKAVIQNSLTKDISFKNQMIGVVIGQFLPQEFKDYQARSSEFNKRISQMIAKRLQDSVEEWA